MNKYKKQSYQQNNLFVKLLRVRACTRIYTCVYVRTHDARLNHACVREYVRACTRVYTCVHARDC